MSEIYTFDLKGILDNCLDFIDQVEPANTKFSNSLRKIPARSNSFKWVTDENDAYTGTHAQLEGIEATTAGTDADGTTNTQADALNYTQRFSKFVTVTKSAAAAGVHGRVSETQYQLEKAVSALKNQIEVAFLSDQAKVVGTATVAAKTDGVKAQIPTACVVEGAIDATSVKKVLDELFTRGSEADTIMCGKDAYEALAKLSNGYVDGVKINGKPVPSFVDSQGNVYGVIASRYLHDTAMFVYNSKDWSMVIFRDWKISQLATTGSYDRYLVEVECGLRHDGKFKSGLIVPAAAPRLMAASPVEEVKKSRKAK